MNFKSHWIIHKKTQKQTNKKTWRLLQSIYISINQNGWPSIPELSKIITHNSRDDDNMILKNQHSLFFAAAMSPNLSSSDTVGHKLSQPNHVSTAAWPQNDPAKQQTNREEAFSWVKSRGERVTEKQYAVIRLTEEHWKSEERGYKWLRSKTGK